MNSMSKCHDHDDCHEDWRREKEHCRHEDCEREHCHHEDCRKERCHHEEREREHCPTIIKCSPAASVTIPPATVLGATFPLTALTLDTECLECPIVKLEFTSNLVAAVAFTGTINFQIFKVCKCHNTPIPVGSAFTFNLVALLSSQTFTFFVCDSNFCRDDECCTYTVNATVTSPVTVGTLSINNASLGAIATCGKCQSCC